MASFDAEFWKRQLEGLPVDLPAAPGEIPACTWQIGAHPCGRDADLACVRCGTALCKGHAQYDPVTGDAFCLSCCIRGGPCSPLPDGGWVQ